MLASEESVPPYEMKKKLSVKDGHRVDMLIQHGQKKYCISNYENEMLDNDLEEKLHF